MSGEALENAMRAHFALLSLLAEEQADGLAMNCLRYGMLKPCTSFSLLNNALIPAACQDDWTRAMTLLLGRHLIGRGGFIHNLCWDTVRNTYYASHCSCPTRLHGPEGAEAAYLLRRFAHTNDGSCAIQVFWPEDEPVTIVQYHWGKPGTQPDEPSVAAGLDVCAGKVVRSIPMPSAAGFTTNVEVAVTDRDSACEVRGGQGAHNVLFCGDFARQFRRFANLHKLRLLDTGYREKFPT